MKKILLIGYGQFGKILFGKLRAINAINVTIATHDYKKHLARANWAVIATPVETHAEIVRDCLEAGLNVFCEKPLSENPKDAEEIFELARTKNKKIYIDDVFRWRIEYEKIKKLDQKLKSISFHMTKYGTFNDSLLAAHTYHDLYLLLDMTNFAPISDIKILRAECPIEPNRVDILEYSFMAGTVQIHGFYNRTQNAKQKIVTMNKDIVWSDNSLLINGALKPIPAHDALAVMLEGALTETTDFAYNNKLALEAIRLLARIQENLIS